MLSLDVVVDTVVDVPAVVAAVAVVDTVVVNAAVGVVVVAVDIVAVAIVDVGVVLLPLSVVTFLLLRMLILTEPLVPPLMFSPPEFLVMNSKMDVFRLRFTCLVSILFLCRHLATKVLSTLLAFLSLYLLPI